jgi:hypothetical protein
VLFSRFFCIFEETEFELESIKKEDEGKAEKMSRFFEVEEMFDFDNLGFTNTRDNFKVRHFVFTAVLMIRPPGCEVRIRLQNFTSLSKKK